MRKDFSRRPSDSHEPKAVGAILDEMLRSDSRFAAAYRRFKEALDDEAEVETDRLFKDFYPSTEPGIDLKIITRKPGRMSVGDSMSCMLIHDSDYHYTAVEHAIKRKVAKQRNPHVYVGRRINVKRKDDDTLYPTFNHPRYTKDFSFQDFCCEAAEELLMVAGLVENESLEEESE